MYLETFEIIAFKNPYTPDRIKLLLVKRERRDGAEFVTVAKPVEYEALKAGEDPTAPTVVITAETAQQLADELWRLGIRPAGAAGSAGQLDAVKDHLQDMRALVFKTEQPKAEAHG